MAEMWSRNLLWCKKKKSLSVLREGDVSGDEHQWSRVVLFLFLIFLEREEGHDLSQTLRELYVPVVHKRGVASHKDTTHRLQTHNHTVICVPLRCFYIMLSFFFFFFFHQCTFFLWEREKVFSRWDAADLMVLALIGHTDALIKGSQYSSAARLHSGGRTSALHSVWVNCQIS